MKYENDHGIIENYEEAGAIDWFMCSKDPDYKNSGTRFSIGDILGRGFTLEAITAKEGDAVFGWWLANAPFDSPDYSDAWNGFDGAEDIVKSNALTIGKTVGELRELLAWAKRV